MKKIKFHLDSVKEALNDNLIVLIEVNSSYLSQKS